MLTGRPFLDDAIAQKMSETASRLSCVGLHVANGNNLNCSAIPKATLGENEPDGDVLFPRTLSFRLASRKNGDSFSSYLLV